MNGRTIVFVVPADRDGMTAGTFLRRFCGVSARLLTRLKRTENGMLRNGSPIRSVDILRAGDRLVLTQPVMVSSAVPVEMPLDILYEDDDVLVVNKPPFMPVHPTRDHQYDTLSNAVAAYAASQDESYSFHAVNRLDRDTSGIVLIAKNPYAAACLPHTAEKLYMALCEGELAGGGTIDAPLRIRPGHTIQRETASDGARAVTHYTAVRCAYDHTLLHIILETGRTHQIRAHLSSIGHPLAGDDMYGGSRRYFERQCLHCAEMRFLQPRTREAVILKCPPEDWLGRLEKESKK